MKALITRTSDVYDAVYTKSNIRDFASVEGLISFVRDEKEPIIICDKHIPPTYDMEGITPADYDFEIEIYDDYRE